MEEQSHIFRILSVMGGSKRCTWDMQLPLIDCRVQLGEKKQGMLKRGARRLREAALAQQSAYWNEGHHRARILQRSGSHLEDCESRISHIANFHPHHLHSSMRALLGPGRL